MDSLLKVASDTVTSTKSANYPVVVADRNTLILGDSTSGTITMTLPDATVVGNGFLLSFKKLVAANSMIIAGSGGQTIDGGSTYTLIKQYESVTMVSNGTNWDNLSDGGLDIPVASETEAGIIEIATTAEVQTGTDNTRAVTPAGLKNALGLTKYAESGQLTLNSAQTFTHGLGGIPLLVQAEFVCLVADAGYSVGDRLAPASLYQGDSRGMNIWWNSTTIGVRTANFFALQKASSQQILTASSWRIVVRAWI